MSTCTRCGAAFGCAMADGGSAPCWCTLLPPVTTVPPVGSAAGCWCPACLEQHSAPGAGTAPLIDAPLPESPPDPAS